LSFSCPPPLNLKPVLRFVPQVSGSGDVVCATVQGNRNYQEDSSSLIDKNATGLMPIALYGVYDGHGGSGASEFCKTHLLPTIMKNLSDFSSLDVIKSGVVRGFIETENYFKATRTPYFFDYPDESGACLLVAILFRDRLLLASAGDVRSLLVYADGTHERVSVEHPATLAEEKDRIHAAGCYISAGRINGNLAVARSLGDFHLKVGSSAEDKAAILADPVRHAVTCVPEITIVTPKSKPHMLLLMTDGVGEGHDMTSHFIAESSKTIPPEELARFVVMTALERGSQDNITCMTIPLDSWNQDEPLVAAGGGAIRFVPPPTLSLVGIEQYHSLYDATDTPLLGAPQIPLALGRSASTSYGGGPPPSLSLGVGCVPEVFDEDGGDATPSLLSSYSSGGGGIVPTTCACGCIHGSCGHIGPDEDGTPTPGTCAQCSMSTDMEAVD
jgi:serine/threonine protein phosphatase PrpC